VVISSLHSSRLLRVRTPPRGPRTSLRLACRLCCSDWRSGIPRRGKVECPTTRKMTKKWMWKLRWRMMVLCRSLKQTRELRWCP
ncbi:hypothetical protein HDU93_009880, partial [Gonapodya sp. JEL0774]